MKPFTVLMLAGTASKIADQLLLFAIPLAVLQETDSIGAAVLAFAARGVSYVASPFLGVLIDRYDRRLVYVLAQCQQAVFVGLAAVVIDDVYWVAVTIMISGLGGVVSSISSYFVLIPQLVQTDRRTRAVARFSIAIEMAKIGGPLAAGLLVGVLGGRTAVLLNAAVYLAAGLLALALPAMRQQPKGREPVLTAVAQGFRWLRSSRKAYLLVITMSLANLGVGAVDTVFVTLMGERGVPAQIAGALISAGIGLGALGAGSASRLFIHAGSERAILYWQMLSTTGLLVMALPGTASKVGGYALICFALGGSNVVSISFRQDLIPEAYAGRINSVIRMFITGAIPLSGLIFAFAASSLPGWAFWLPSITLLAISLGTWSWHSRSLGFLARLSS